MSQHLITNQDKFLSEVISEILPGCDKAFFLVGYFYFSGFQEIYEQLREKQVHASMMRWSFSLVTSLMSLGVMPIM